MPFIQTGIRKHRGELPIEEVKTSAEVLSSLLIEKKRKGIRLLCESIAERFVREDISFKFSSSHTKLGHSIKMTASMSINDNEHTEKRQTPYYSQEYYTPEEVGVHILRDIIYMIMSATTAFSYHFFYRNWGGFEELEQATFELMKTDIKDYDGDRINNRSAIQSSRDDNKNA